MKGETRVENERYGVKILFFIGNWLKVGNIWRWLPYVKPPS